jgi:cell division protein FtsI (penicillin-binding protein 3)
MSSDWGGKPSNLRRRQLILGLLAVAALGVVGRAVWLQLLASDFFEHQGELRHTRAIVVPALRGMILDRHGEPLAVSTPVASICADPEEALKERERLAPLAEVLQLATNDLVQRLELAAREQRRFVYLQRHIEPQLGQLIEELNIKGVWSQQEYRRYYPDAEVSAHLLGFADLDDRGREGLELTFDEWLRGAPGAKRVLKDSKRRVVEMLAQIKAPQPGKNLTLSIDRRVQYLVYRSLKAAVSRHRAASASAVVLDVASGEVLAMVSQPAGNPNDRYSRRTPALLRNRAVSDLFEPGSTLKPFTVALALEQGRFAPDTPISTSPGFIKIGRYAIRDIRNYKTLTVTDVIAKSSNVGITKIAQQLLPQALWQLYGTLGFGESTELQFSGERSGVLSHFSGWSEAAHITHAYGYGLSVTALQLAQAYAVLAADGVRRPLSLLRQEEPPLAATRVISTAASRQVRAMLEAAVRAGGTGAKAAVPGYRVAGKTGTVRKTHHGRYVAKRYYSLFAGMAPASQPRLVMVVVIDDPKGKKYYGGDVAAPVFSEVMAEALPLLQIAPDALPAGNIVPLAHYGGETG